MSVRMVKKKGACATTAMVFGALAGIGGATHGVGEVLQGDVAVGGFWLESWTTGPIARNMGGEPGITVLPTVLAAGVVTLCFSIAVLGWSLIGVRSHRDGVVLIALSAGLLLAGGGIGPPVIGMLAGTVGRWDADRQPRWLERSSARVRRVLASAWRPLFALAAANGLFLVLGSVILVYSIDLNRPSLFEWSFYLTVVMLLAMMLTAPAHDAQRREVAGVDGPPGTPARNTAW